MIIITENSKNPIRRLESMIDSIYKTKFPDDNSIIGDNLRGRLQDAYNLKLNMCDTHSFKFASNDGTIPNHLTKGEPENYYIYEGDGNKTIIENDNFEILGEYPEGILLGFLDSGFRDKEYLRKNISIYFASLILIAKTYLNKYNDDNNLMILGEAYRHYINNTPIIFALKNILEKFPDFKLEEISGYYLIEGNKEIEYYVKDRTNFLKVVSYYDYAKFFKYLVDSLEEINKKENVNKEFEDKYEEFKKYELEETKKALKESSENIISNILDDHAIKLKNDLDENKNPKSGREFHVYMYNCFEDEDLDEIGLCIDAKSTKTQIDIGANYIYTTNTHYVSTDLIRNGYRIFIHLDKDTVREIKIGDNDWTDREIKWVHKLETFLYNGEMK